VNAQVEPGKKSNGNRTKGGDRALHKKSPQASRDGLIVSGRWVGRRGAVRA